LLLLATNYTKHNTKYINQ